jgi:dihydrolipoamide dehydrogenase
MSQNFDLVIIGGGPGGYVAAIRAAQLKMSVAVVERENLGGICLNWGCIPTKALLRSAEIYHQMQNADAYGLSVEGASFDMEKIVKRSRGVAKQLNQGVTHLLKKNKVTVFNGNAKLTSSTGVEVSEASGKATKLSAKNIMIATGARARELPHLKADGKNIWTYRHAMTPKTCPKSILVIGSGAIGIEFASFYNDFGAKVTVVEVMDRVLPVEDADISKIAETSFRKQGFDIRLKTSVETLKSTPTGVEASIKDGSGKVTVEKFEKAILAIGIAGNVEDLGLQALRIPQDRGHIVTNKWGHTGIANIWAIGDVTGPPWLAHKASHEGVIAVERIAHLAGMAGFEDLHALDKANIPGCTYSRPQVASVGLTEAKAIEAGYKVRVGKFPFIGNGKAIALGETEGMIKTVFDAATGEMLGAHMIGAEVTELIQGYTIARGLETTEAELLNTVFPHPTLSEMMHESVLDAMGRVIHM